MTRAGLQPVPWSVGGVSVPGASHLRRGVPNQDAIAWLPQEGPADRAILALSDGHGSAAHRRSDVGSRLAVEAAREVLAGALADVPPPDPFALGGAIVRLWRERALAHFEETGPPDGFEPSADPLHLYGATLIAAAVTPHGLVALQLGDGDLLLRLKDGTIRRPLPDDADLVGDQTYSLCLHDAERRLRAALVPDPDGIALVMLSTDGLSKSFEQEADFLRLSGAWHETLRSMGLDTVLAALPEWLSAASRRGSGDDITLGFLVNGSTATGEATDAPVADEARPGRRGLADAVLTLLRRIGRPGLLPWRARASSPASISASRSDSGNLP